MSFLCWVAEFSLTDRMISSVSHVQLGQTKDTQERLCLSGDLGTPQYYPVGWCTTFSFSQVPAIIIIMIPTSVILGCLPREVFKTRPTGPKPRDKPRARWRSNVSPALEPFSIPPAGAGVDIWGERSGHLSCYPSGS